MVFILIKTVLDGWELENSTTEVYKNRFGTLTSAHLFMKMKAIKSYMDTVDKKKLYLSDSFDDSIEYSTNKDFHVNIPKLIAELKKEDEFQVRLCEADSTNDFQYEEPFYDLNVSSKIASVESYQIDNNNRFSAIKWKIIEV